MKIQYLVIIILLTMNSACVPSADALATAMVQTQASWTDTPAPTLTPTKTPRPTAIPQKKYILELGVCLAFLQDMPGDPKDAGCTAIYRETITVRNGQNSVTASVDASPFYPYCSIYTTSGRLLAKKIAKAGATDITCIIP